MIIKREKSLVSKKPPLMIACSAHIDEYTKQKAILTGFDLVMEAPLQSDSIQTILNII